MPDEMPDDETAARARLQGKRVALGVVIAMAVAFILATAVHVIPAVFGIWIAPLRADAPDSAACVVGLRDLELALDANDFESPSRIEPRDAVETPQRQAVEHACAGTPEGLAAWASFERLRMAREQLKGRDPAALSQLKRDLAAHLPSELR